MGTLRGCIRKLGKALSKDDAAEIRSRVQEFGGDPVKAANDFLEELQYAREDMVQQVLEQAPAIAEQGPDYQVVSQETLDEAIEFSKEAHKDQTDNAGMPYFGHIHRVMSGTESREDALAAVLHDIVEDTPVTLDDLRGKYPEYIVEAVDALTRRGDESRIDAAYRARDNDIARRVKLLDVTDNLDPTRLANPTEWQKKRRQEYLVVRNILNMEKKGYIPADQAEEKAEDFRRDQAAYDFESLLRVAPANQDAYALTAGHIMSAYGKTHRTVDDNGNATTIVDESPGLMFRDPGVKGKQRALKKFISRNNDITRMTDIVRGGFSVTTPEQSDQILAELNEIFEVMDEGWYITDEGYFDRKAILKFPDGTLTEVQFWPPGLFEAKELNGGHDLFKEWRVISEKAPVRDLTAEEISEMDRLTQAMRDLYMPVQEALSSEWLKVLGTGGAPGNLSANSVSESGLADSDIAANEDLLQEDSPLNTVQTYGPRDTAGNPSQDQNLISESGMKGSLSQLSLNFDAPAQVEPAAIPEDSYTQIVGNQETSQVNVGVTQIETAGDALHVIAPFRKLPQETFLSIIMDKDNNILEIQQHSIGDIAAAGVNQRLVIGAAVDVPGADKIMFAHNHPSGNITQSGEDHRLTDSASSLARAANLTPMGMLVTGSPGTSGTHYSYETGETTVETTKAARNEKIPLTVRTFRKQGPAGIMVSDPRSAFKAVEGRPTGVLMLNAAHQVVGHYPMTLTQMRTLRRANARGLLKALHQANASATIVNTEADKSSKLSEVKNAVTNMGAFLEGTGTRYLDAIYGGEVSAAEQGSRSYPMKGEGTWNSQAFRESSGATDYTREQAEAAVKELNKVANRAYFQVKVVSADEIPIALREEGMTDVKGFTVGPTAYLVHDRLANDEDLAVTYAHELKGHVGVNEIMSKEDWADTQFGYQEMKSLGGKEFTSIYNELKSRYSQEHGGTEEFALSEDDELREFIALAAERNVKKGAVRKFLDKVAAAVMKGLRAIGFNRPFSMTNINEILAKSEGYLKKPVGLGALNTRNVRTRRANQEMMAQNSQRERELGIANNLPMDNESRMARAEAMGFDTSQVMYHGTRPGNDIKAFNKSPGGIYFTPDPGYAEGYTNELFDDTGAVGAIYPAYLRMGRTLDITAEYDSDAWNDFVYHGTDYQLIDSEGYDSMRLIDKETGEVDQVIIFDPERIRSVNAAFDPEFESSPKILASRQPRTIYTEAEKEAMDMIGPQATPKVSVADHITNAKKKVALTWRQGVLDQYNSFDKILNNRRAWMEAHLAKAAPGALEAVTDYGQIFLEENAIGVDTDAKSFKQALEPLEGDTKPFFSWMIGHRAARLKKEGREHYFNDDQIKELQGLNRGREELFDQVRKDYEQINNSIVKIAVQTGAVNAEDAKIWAEDGFYVPFFRIMEEQDNVGPKLGSSTSLVNLVATHHLKGGTEMIADPIDNILRNWLHLIQTSLNNQAAREAVSAARELELARPIGKAGGVGNLFDLETEIQPISKEEAGKNAVYVLVNGKKQWYALDESDEGQLVLESLRSLNTTDLNNIAMQSFRWFKRGLTMGVTASPEFKVANLFRDSANAIAVSGVSGNPFKNVGRGWRSTAKGADEISQMIAGGGAFGDSGYIYGGDPALVTKTVMEGAARDTILDSRRLIKKMWDGYQDIGARMENVNRAAEFSLREEAGDDRLTRNFKARDQMDFTRTGSWQTVRALTQVVPFLNARAQGLDKLNRARIDPAQKGRFYVATATYAAMSVLAYLAMKDDEDYKAAEQWERDAYHLFKLPGSDVMWRLPRPFEFGAIASMIERLTEQLVNDEVNGDLFKERLQHTLMETFNFNPMPQMFRPVAEVAMNENWFTDRPIESMGMQLQNLSTENRKNAYTSESAVLASEIGAAVVGDNMLSPVQIQHLVRGYAGWVGSTALAATDMLITRPVTNSPVPPAMRWTEYPVIKRFARSGPPRNTKYATDFRDNMNEISRAYGDIKAYKALGEMDKAQKTFIKNQDKLALRKQYNKIQKDVSAISKQMARIRLDKKMNGPEKRAEMDRLQVQKNFLTERAAKAGARAF